MGSIKFDVTGNNKNVLAAFRGVQDGVKQMAQVVEQQGQSIENVFGRIRSIASMAFSGFTAKEIMSTLANVRGDFQQFEIAFETMLHSGEKAKAMILDLAKLAATTPFDMKGVVSGAKQLLAYGFAADQITDTMRRLGDISAGLGLNLQDLTWLYGTTMVQGRLFTRDLMQFTSRGIPMTEALAKQFGVTKDKVSELVTAGKIGFPEVEKAIKSMTDEGGQFGGLMEKQSHSITGQISNIQDSIEMAINDLGTQTEGLMNDALDITSKVIDHWKEIGKVILTAATAYGTYKAVLMTATALQTLNNRILQQAIVEKTLAAAAGINLSNAEAVAAARTKFLTLAQRGLAVALKETAAATLLNPYVLLAAAITSAVVAIYSYVTRVSAAEAAETALEKSLDNTNKKLDERKQKLQDLVAIIQNADSTELQKQLAFDELSKIAPSLTEVYNSVEKLSKADLSQVNQQLNELSDEKREESLKKQINELNKIIDTVAISHKDVLKEKYGLNLSIFSGWEEWDEATKNFRDELIKQLSEIEDAKKKIAVPTKIDVELAKDKYEQSKDQLSYLSNFAVAMKNDIEKNPTKIPFDGGEAERVVAELEKEISELKKEQEKNPIQFTADKQKALDKYQELLSDIMRWKNIAWKQGTFTIPVEIQFKMKQLQEETNKAKGYFNFLTGKYEESNKDESYSTAKKKAKSEYIIALQAEKDARKGSNAAWEKANENLEAKKKIYDKYWGSTSRANKKASTDAKKDADKQRKAQEELNNSLKALQQKNTDETISLMQEGTEKKLAEIKNDYAKRKAEIDKQEAEFKKKNKEAGKKEALTSAQSEALTKARDLATQEYNKKLDEVNREALTSMRDYLKEYGSLYQQKQAIAEEYEEKISKAQTEGEKLSLKQQKKKELQNIEIDAIKQNIDWGSIFSDFGAMFKDQLEPTIKKLQELSKSTTDVNEQKTIQELISKLQGSATVWDSDIFNKVSDDINAYQSAMQGYIDAQEIEATKAVTKAQEDLAKSKKGGNKNSISEAEGNLSRAQNVLATASNNVLKFGSAVQKTSSDLQTSAQKAVSQFQQLEDGLQGLTSGSLKSIGNSILGLDKLFGGTMQKDVANTLAKGIQGLLGKDSNAAKVLSEALGDSGMAGEIISAVLSILDILKGGFGTLITDLTETVFGAITGILDDVLSGDIVMKPLKSVGDNVSHILNTLSFGGFNSLFGGDGNAKKVNDTIERLTDRNTLLQQSIEDLTDAMKNAYGSKAISYYDQAYKNQQETNQNYLDIAKAQASYHASHGSWNHYWSGFSSDEMDWINKNIKSDFNGDLFSLSPEEMKLLRGNVAIWEHIEKTGKGNYGGRLTEKLNDYIDQAGKLDELSDKLKESLTQISFESMKDSFISDLMDMSKSAQDFADDFAEMMQKALLSYSMEDLINGDLKKLYDDWAKAIKDNDGKLTEADIETFNKRYDDIVQEGLKRRDDWAKVTGYTGSSSSSQTATSGGWASMGQDTADELNGRFTALQIAGENISASMVTAVAQMETIISTGISTNGAVAEIRNMMIMTNSYLEDIVKYSKLTYNDFGSKLDEMNRRLKEI